MAAELTSAWIGIQSRLEKARGLNSMYWSKAEQMDFSESVMPHKRFAFNFFLEDEDETRNVI